jgi:hypothetical protein
VWYWYAPLLDLTSGDLVIPLDVGSGAARVFDLVHAGERYSHAAFGRRGLPLAVWVQEGTAWSCGSCFNALRTRAFDGMFHSQIWIDGSADEGYWADATTAHEFGHWVVASYGTQPGEGGVHYVAIPTFPGQAWSEGFATWFSSVLRADPGHLLKQGGTTFWFSLEAREYPGGLVWQRATPAGGLLQRMDENEAAAILWALSSGAAATKPILDGVASSHMNTRPFKRGYTRHTWTATPQGITDERDTGESAPCLPDELDALMCAGFPRVPMDRATDPAAHYPYPSGNPLCP